MHISQDVYTYTVHRQFKISMAGVHHKLGELLHQTRRLSAAALDKAMSLLCWVSKSYAHHHVTERVARWRRAVAGGQFWRRLGSLLVHVAYFLTISWLGYVILGQLRFRAPPGDGRRRPRGIDLFFTAVSAATVSSMSTVEMEVFSNGQLVVLTALMFAGGEVFISLLGLASKWSKLRRQAANRSRRVKSHDEKGVELEMPPPVADMGKPTSIITDETSSIIRAHACGGWRARRRTESAPRRAAASSRPPG
nr:HKT7 protein [Agrostis stolonifera]